MIRVLVVEDDEAMAVALRDGFTYEGYEVLVARDGEEGLRMAREEDPDLMILDGPAHAEQGGRVMAHNSDLVLMPTGYSLDDMEPQIEAAYELEDAGVPSDRVFFCFCRVDAVDLCVAHGRADHAHPEFAGSVDVVDELVLSNEEWWIFFAKHPGTHNSGHAAPPETLCTAFTMLW